MKAEWRTNNAQDTVIVIGDDGEIMHALPAVSQVIRDLTGDPGDLRDWHGQAPPDGVAPEDYGGLVASRVNGGDLVIADQDLFDGRCRFFGIVD